MSEQLHSVSVYCDLSVDLPQHEFEILDELSVLLLRYPTRTLAYKDKERRQNTQRDFDG